MSRLLRTLLTWLLALALPVQGHAAQAMLFCGPEHDPMAAAVAAVAGVGHDHAAHGHGGWQAGPAAQAPDHAAHEHGGTGHGAPTAAMQDAGQAEPADGAASIEVAQAKCSVCASCCSMAAIASHYALPAAPAPCFEYQLAPFEPHAGRTAGGLERPPKACLA